MALLALLAVIMLGASWFLVRRLNAESGSLAAVKQARNAEVLNKAKQALIGYVAMQTANMGEDNPGALPCPEAAGYFDNPAQEGQSASSCSLPKVGRFPWRTIGTEKLVDSSGEPLWYVVSPGWALASTSGNTNINSSTLGQLTVDGKANDSVALIIAPGPAFNVPACASIPAWNQVRPTSGTPDWRNYLECENATSPADTTFVTGGASGSFNDQVMRVSAAEILGGIEAAIATRIKRQIAPVLSDVYLGTAWGLTGKERMFPFAATFADPSLSATSFKGAPPATQGLLPFNYGEACNPATEPRCLLMAYMAPPPTPPVAYAAGGFGYIQTQTCGWDPTDTSAALCDGEYHEDSTSAATLAGPGMRIEMTAKISNVATGLRVLDAWIGARDDVALGAWQVMPRDVVTTMNPDGSATIRFGANLPNIDTMGWGTYAQYRIRLKVADHPLLSTRSREISFDSGSTTEIRVGQTVVGAISGASGRVSRVAVNNNTYWESSLNPAAGTLTFYNVTGSFANGENLRVSGVTRARSASSDSNADTDTSWFVRNEWYKHVYYAVAGNYAWSNSGTCADSGTITCLQVANLPVAADQTKQRALLVLMGRRLSSQTRPSASLADYLDSTENRNLDGVFEQRKAGTTFNDRFISISKNP